jgi:hypothetical protein
MTAQEFIFKTAPFKKIEGDEYKELYKELSNDNLSVSGYNPIYNVETTYHLESCPINVGAGPMGQNGLDPVDDNIRCMSFECGRFKNILTLVLYYDKEKRYIQKVGTYPSLRDFHKDDLKKYNKVLTDKQRMELITAIMIANNGVGIGSYVYLRRIFEGIVFEEAKNAIEDGAITEEDFNKKRMDEKIVAIKDYLPAFLYDNHSALYGILSLGIHQLDEEECLGFYPVLYDCIILVLEDRLAQKKKEEMTRKATASLNKIAAAIKK